MQNQIVKKNVEFFLQVYIYISYIFSMQGLVPVGTDRYWLFIVLCFVIISYFLNLQLKRIFKKCVFLNTFIIIIFPFIHEIMIKCLKIALVVLN